MIFSPGQAVQSLTLASKKYNYDLEPLRTVLVESQEDLNHACSTFLQDWPLYFRGKRRLAATFFGKYS